MAGRVAGASLSEQQFLLRFADPTLADRVRRALREEESLGPEGLQIEFPDSGRHGKLLVDGTEHRVDVMHLPTIVESYKTYDDTNLVKTGDIGQVLLVGGRVPPKQIESVDGVTPPMRRARERHFKKVPVVDPKVVSQVEVDLLNILSGGAPAGFEYHDVEEEYVVDAKTGVGSWQTAKPSKDTDKDKGDGGDSAPPTAEKPEKEKGAKRSRSKAAAKAAAAAAAAAEAEVEAEAAAA